MEIARLVNTDSRIIERKIYKPFRDTMKPLGLWYSIGEEWIQWVKENMPSWYRKYTHNINVNEDELLIINDIQQLDEFNKEYGTDSKWPHIKWDRVADRYCGVEIRNFHDIKAYTYSKFEPLYTWFWGLGCSSGCIWNMDCIT